MATLFNKTKNRVVISDLAVTKSHQERAVGLLSRNSLHENQGLWIRPCRSVHTFFMKFAIDVAFVDRDLRVKAVYENVGPWKLLIPAMWKVNSVFELAPGTLKRTQTQIGDQLNVADENS
jgi:uncharacterized membrane protein (UPF0127 family)